MKGCVQGYGNYNELTISGIDSRELFDDTENVEPPNLPSTDIIIEGWKDDLEESHEQNIRSSYHKHLLPTKKTRKKVGSRHTGNDHGSTFDQMSIYTTPSMLSLISMPNDSEGNVGVNAVIAI